MKTLLPVTAALILLGSCKSPPKPPTVDESTKRPANTAAAVELQACRGDRQRLRLSADENERALQVAAQTLVRLQEAPLPNFSAMQGNLLAFCSTALLVGASAGWIRASEARYRHVVGQIPLVLYSVRLPRGLSRAEVGRGLVELEPLHGKPGGVADECCGVGADRCEAEHDAPVEKALCGIHGRAV